MDKKASSSQDPEIRKGPWTTEEDLILINYIANHGPVCRPEAHREKLSAVMAELPEARRPKGKHHSRRAAIDHGTTLEVGKQTSKELKACFG